MIFPTIKPREVPKGLEWATTFSDHATVVQEDGAIAQFLWMQGQKEKGWQFSHYKDANDFCILSEAEQTGDYAQLLLKSEVPITDMLSNCSRIVIGADEELHGFEYGGCLSGRGGVFITKKDDSNKVLKVKQTWMS